MFDRLNDSLRERNEKRMERAGNVENSVHIDPLLVYLTVTFNSKATRSTVSRIDWPMGTIAAGFIGFLNTSGLMIYSSSRRPPASKIAICTIFPVITGAFFRKTCTNRENGVSTYYSATLMSRLASVNVAQASRVHVFCASMRRESTRLSARSKIGKQFFGISSRT
ncbi:hypothetical protein K0M31_011447 [Melipona bicolor]|uniref:Uncharacterized protein n=1 Tax=Melipona bicolor TaxID=60889 RepID=A0AA40KV21_9HYME|nr:hypothetical protein K0M31_011447 [Melipona bicolor]